MAELKTQKNDADVHEFITTLADTDQKRKDSNKTPRKITLQGVFNIRFNQ